MKKFIILAIVLCAATVQAQYYGNDTRTQDAIRDIARPYNSEPTYIPRQPTEYPPDYFTVRPMQPPMPSGPTYGYPGMRGYDERTGLWVPSPYTNSW